MKALFRSSLIVSSSAMNPSSSSCGMSSTTRVCIFLHTEKSCCLNTGGALYFHANKPVSRNEKCLLFNPSVNHHLREVKTYQLSKVSLHMTGISLLIFYTSQKNWYQICTTCMSHMNNLHISSSSSPSKQVFWDNTDGFSCVCAALRKMWSADTVMCAEGFPAELLPNA